MVCDSKDEPVSATVTPAASGLDMRQWLARHPRVGRPYTRQRIETSFEYIERVLGRFPDARSRSALDLGCGSGFDTFALAERFATVIALDASRRCIAEGKLLAHLSGRQDIRFRRARMETFTPASPVDFVYCNIMSDMTSSRTKVAAAIARSTAVRGDVYYAEETEGWAPMVIGTAVEQRDAAALRTGLHQVVGGFLGTTTHRFFVAGSARPLFESLGFEVLAVEQKTWNGLTYTDALWLRRRAAHGPDCVFIDHDYVALDPEFAEMRVACHAASNNVPDWGLIAHENRFKCYLVLLKMAANTLGEDMGKGATLTQRVRARGGWVSEPDWPRMDALMSEFVACSDGRTAPPR
jgi:SAM-dependent methyltransferase